VVDHGSLVDLTADFDVNFVGSLAKTVVLAQISNPMPVPGGDSPGSAPSGDVLPFGDSGQPVAGDGPSGEVLGDREAGGGAAPGGGSGGGGAAGGGSGGGGGAAGTAEKGGKLPFTGYAALAVAGLGAAFTTTGVAIRSALRRRR